MLERIRPNGGIWVSTALIGVLVLILAAIIYPTFSRARHSARRQSDSHAGTTALESIAQSSFDASSEAGVAWAGSLDRMVIKRAEMSLRVANVNSTHRALARLATETGGFVAESSVWPGSASVVLRIPAERYSPALAAIERLGKVLDRKETGQDITEAYVDVQSRIRNLQREEQAMLGVLNRAARVADILEVERELARVRGEVESATGRLSFCRIRLPWQQ